MSVVHQVEGARIALLAGQPAIRAVGGPVRGPSWDRAYVLAVLALDLAAGLTASLSALSFGWVAAGPLDDVVLALSLPLVWVGVLATMRLYDARLLVAGAEEFRRVCRAGIVLVAVCGLLAYTTARPVAGGVVLGVLPLTVALDCFGRQLARKALRAQRRRGRAMHRVLLVGHRAAVRSLEHQLSTDTSHGMHVVGVCHVDRDPRLVVDGDPLVVGGLDDLARAVGDTRADLVAVLSSPETAGATLRQIAWDLEGTRAELVVAPGLAEIAGARLTIRPVAGLALLHLDQPEFGGARRWLKEGLDRSVALLAIVVLMPVFLLLALAIQADHAGPGLYRQTRVGIRGRRFTLYKFRSMCAEADQLRPQLQILNDRPEGPLFKVRADPRVTRVGRVLRRFSLDELPQLFNVLRGEMSLVGPRPPLPEEVARYGSDARRRLLVKPGLTGLWQVSGRSDLTWEESVRLDLRYVDNWSLGFDLQILWRTLRVVVRGTGAY